MNLIWVYILIGFIVLIGCVIGLVVSSAFSQEWKQKFEKIAKLINGRVIESRIPLFGTTKVAAKFLDIPFEIMVIGGSQYSPPDIRITFLKKPPFQMSITKEGIVYRIVKIGFLKEIQTGYPVFDKKFLIKTDNEEKCKEFLQNDNVREIILDLYEKEWHIVFRKKYIELIKNLKPKSKTAFAIISKLIDIEEIAEILEKQKTFLSKLYSYTNFNEK